MLKIFQLFSLVWDSISPLMDRVRYHIMGFLESIKGGIMHYAMKEEPLLSLNPFEEGEGGAILEDGDSKEEGDSKEDEDATLEEEDSDPYRNCGKDILINFFNREGSPPGGGDCPPLFKDQGLLWVFTEIRDEFQKQISAAIGSEPSNSSYLLGDIFERCYHTFSVITEHVNAFLDGNPWLYDIMFFVILTVQIQKIINIYLIHQGKPIKNKICYFDFRWLLPTLSKVKKLQLQKVLRLIPLTAWCPIPNRNQWALFFMNSSGINHLQKLCMSLDLLPLRGLKLTKFFVAKAFVDRGLRMCIESEFATALMRISTRIYDPLSETFQYYFFNILVYTGLGVVVWYTMIPSVDLVPASPVGFESGYQHHFQNPSSIVEGYKRVSYLISKDISDTVIASLKDDLLFNRFSLNQVSVEDLSDMSTRQRLTCIGTALMIAVFITTKTIAIPA